MGIISGIFRKKEKKNENTGYAIKLVSDSGSGFYSFGGNLYKSDIIRAFIRPKVKSVGKLLAKHIREYKNKDGDVDIKINPEPYLRFLLQEPNPYMSGQMLQEKLATQLAFNNNAFALIVRDENGYPTQIYPIPCYSAKVAYSKTGELLIKFTLTNHEVKTFRYKDVVHLRQDFGENDLFGDSPANALIPLMEIVTTMDQGIIKAIKNSNIIRWLLKFKSILRKEDMDLQVKTFVDTYLNLNSDNSGAMASDPRYDVEQVKADSFVANAAQMKETVQRLYNFFNTNEAIVQSKYTEDEWNAYYEAEIEPMAMQLSNEFTRKIFTRKERGFGNSIIFESSNLQHTSMRTKLDLEKMVDRGAMTPNEWRRILNLGPIEGGNKPIRRLDTAVVEGGGNDAEN